MVVAVAAAAGAPAPPSCAGTVISKHLPGAGASISQSYAAGKPGTPSATKNDGCGACGRGFVSFSRGARLIVGKKWRFYPETEGEAEPPPEAVNPGPRSND